MGSVKGDFRTDLNFKKVRKYANIYKINMSVQKNRTKISTSRLINSNRFRHYYCTHIRDRILMLKIRKIEGMS